IVRRNVIFERTKFNQRQQEAGESADSFITALYCLAEHCGYGQLHSEIIRDRLAVGVKDKRLSEQLQMDLELTLDKAVTRIHQSELVKKQQDMLKHNFKMDTVSANVDGITVQAKSFQHKKEAQQINMVRDSRQCTRCGKAPYHNIQQCPAKDVLCNQCNKKGHYARVCRSRTVGEIQAAGEDSDSDSHINCILRHSNFK
ncbi:hypothetical protein LDENG_00257620, partial [Lucifuga dentata]